MRGDTSGAGEMAAERVTGFFLKRPREWRLSERQFPQVVDAVQPLPIDLAQASV